MKIFEEVVDKDLYLPEYISSSDNICFLDIETDGLSHSKNNIILVGLFLKLGDVQKIVQIFCDKPIEEKELLIALSQRLYSVNTIITYNGSSFDLPFIRKKIAKYNITDFLDSIFEIDLYKKIKRHRDKLGLEDCKLKSVERKLGIFREDTISGKESVMLYKKYISEPSFSLRKTILKHNYDDIFYLPDIFKVESYIETNEYMHISGRSKQIRLFLPSKHITFKKNTLIIKGVSQKYNSPSILSYEDSYTIRWDMSAGSLDMVINVNMGLLESGKIAIFIYKSDFNINHKLSNDNILILSVEDEKNYDNIKLLTREIIRHWI